MNIYLAPLEGITGWIYRGAVQKCFGGFDKYFIPFIKPNQMGRFTAFLQKYRSGNFETLLPEKDPNVPEMLKSPLPALSNQMGRFSAREKKDILPEHNKGMHAVPQILTNCAEDFVQTAKKLEQYGYKEINLNVGCPSKTVVTKGLRYNIFYAFLCRALFQTHPYAEYFYKNLFERRSKKRKNVLCTKKL